MFDFFHFAHPEWFYILPLLILLLLLRRRRGSEGSVIYPTVSFIAKYAHKPHTLAGRIGAVCFVLGALALTLALTRPQHIENKSYKTVNGIDIIVAFDLSASMSERDMLYKNLEVSRLEAGKAVITRFIKTRPDDRIGLVAFAGKTKPMSPLTLDHKIVTDIIDALHLDRANPIISADGTAIGSAIAAAASRLEERKQTKSKVIILVTDGASNSGEITPIVAAENAAKLGIRIYTIAVGSKRSTMARGQVGYEFDEPTLKKIAALTGGENYHAEDMRSFAEAFNSINQLEKSEAKTHHITRTTEYFMYCLGAAGTLILLALLLNLLRPEPAP